MKIKLIFSLGDYNKGDLLRIKIELIEKINFLIKKHNGECIKLDNLVKIEKKHPVFVKIPEKYGYDFLTEFRYPLKIRCNNLEVEDKSVSFLERCCCCFPYFFDNNPVKYEIMVYSNICYV